VINDAVESTSRFTGGGTAIASTGADPARSRFNLGIGASYQLDDTTELKANYDYDFRSDYQASAAYLQAQIRF
jgi:outer membrane autotransporter protein